MRCHQGVDLIPALLMRVRPFHYAAVHITDRMRNDERLSIKTADDSLDLADLQPCDNTIQDFLFNPAEAAIPSIHRDAPFQLTGDSLANRRRLGRDDGDGRVLLKAIN